MSATKRWIEAMFPDYFRDEDERESAWRDAPPPPERDPDAEYAYWLAQHPAANEPLSGAQPALGRNDAVQDNQDNKE